MNVTGCRLPAAELTGNKNGDVQLLNKVQNVQVSDTTGDEKRFYSSVPKEKNNANDKHQFFKNKIFFNKPQTTKTQFMNQSTNVTVTDQKMPVEAPIIVGLDIGTTKIAAIAGRKNELGKLEILGFGRANSNGVQHGQVLNIDQTI